MNRHGTQTGTTTNRLGGIAGILSAVAIVLAIAAYFIWPYTGNTTSIAAILSMLQTDRLGGLISLDVSMLLIAPINACRASEQLADAAGRFL